MNRIISRILEKEDMQNVYDFYIGLNANNCIFADDRNDVNSCEIVFEVKGNNMSTNEEDGEKCLNYINNNKNFFINTIGYKNYSITINNQPMNFGLMKVLQSYSSAVTSLNQISRVHTKIEWEPNTVVLDYGGGKFDKATEYMKDKGVLNLVYDPFNRSASHNQEVLDYLKEYGGADSVICANVLNVIQEDSVVENVLQDLDKYCKTGGTIYICVYKGNGSGEGKFDDNRDSYQRNMKTKGYLPIIEKMYPNYDVTIKNDIVIIKK